MIIEYGIFNKAILWFQPRCHFGFTIFEVIQFLHIAPKGYQV